MLTPGMFCSMLCALCDKQGYIVPGQSRSIGGYSGTSDKGPSEKRTTSPQRTLHNVPIV